MAEPDARYEREAEVQSALARVWRAWVRGIDIFAIEATTLREQLDKLVRPIVWGVWVSGYTKLADQWTKSDEATIAAAFILFWRKWSDDLIARWIIRVRDWIVANSTEEATQPTTAKQPPTATTPATPATPTTTPPAVPTPTPSMPTSQGKPTTIGADGPIIQSPQGPPIGPNTPQPSGAAPATSTPSKPTTQGTPTTTPPTIPVTPGPQRPEPTVIPATPLTERQQQVLRDRWGRFREEVVGDQDIERESADAVTWGHSAAEIAAAEEIAENEDEHLVPYWITEKDDRVCKHCDPLDEQPPEVWVPVCYEKTGTGDGPPLHPFCRCWLEWRPVI